MNLAFTFRKNLTVANCMQEGFYSENSLYDILEKVCHFYESIWVKVDAGNIANPNLLNQIRYW